ncbi:MAG: 50S ribosomal protein L4 [Candidatus Melainabacteria bacterium GWF2_37_15]|nr:MAG: 50S ribosomal protein L4 [Candidatus Melainabacteria bacterium GWF2_37_15]
MTKQLIIYNSDGSQLGPIDIDEKVFGTEPNMHVMHLALKRQLNNARAGTASAKTRSEVRGGGKKPWKQKGTGRARAGSTRSPLFAGGGVIFGPKPRDYSTSMPVKARRLALRSALSARTESIKLIKDFSAITNPKTKEFIKVLDSLSVSGKILVITEFNNAENQHLKLASRNVPNVKLILPSNINVKDILEADQIVMTESALNEITERLNK